MLLLDLGNNANGQIKGVSHQVADHLGTYRETVSAICRLQTPELVEKQDTGASRFSTPNRSRISPSGTKLTRRGCVMAGASPCRRPVPLLPTGRQALCRYGTGAAPKATIDISGLF